MTLPHWEARKAEFVTLVADFDETEIQGLKKLATDFNIKDIYTQIEYTNLFTFLTGE